MIHSKTGSGYPASKPHPHVLSCSLAFGQSFTASVRGTARGLGWLLDPSGIGEHHRC